MHMSTTLNFLHVLCWCAARSHCLNINPSFVWNFTFHRAFFLLPDMALAEVLIVISSASDMVLTSPVSREAMSFLAYSPPPQQPVAIWVHARQNELKRTLVKVPQSVGLLSSNKEPFQLLFHVIPILEIEISSLWIFFFPFYITKWAAGLKKKKKKKIFRNIGKQQNYSVM